MSTHDPTQTATDREALQRQLDEYQERQTWSHHVANLSTGKVFTTALKRPVAPLSRAERLARIGIHVDTSIFGRTMYQLTPRRPYQAQPEAWMIASVVGDYSTQQDFILWQRPRQPGFDDLQQLECFFSVSPTRQSLISISVTGRSWPGMDGHVSAGMIAPDVRVRIPFPGDFTDHTIDIVFDPIPGRPTDVFMVPETGIQMLIFRSITVRDLPPVLSPS